MASSTYVSNFQKTVLLSFMYYIITVQFSFIDCAGSTHAERYIILYVRVPEFVCARLLCKHMELYAKVHEEPGSRCGENNEILPVPIFLVYQYSFLILSAGTR